MTNRLSSLFWMLAALACVAPAAHAKTTWEGALVNPTPSQDNALFLVYAYDAEHAWAVGKEKGGSGDTVVGYATSNGRSWQSMSMPQGSSFYPVIITAIVFVDPDHGFMAGTEIEGLSAKNKIFESTNGGQSWAEITQVTASVTAFQRLRSGEIFGTGGGQVVISTDQGATWSDVAVTAPAPDVVPAGLAMLNPSCGWLVGGLPADSDAGRPNSSAGAVWSTDDGGQTWTVTAQDLPFYLRSASFVAGDTGWAVGQKDGTHGVLAVTHDAGATWTEVTVPDHPAMPDVCVMSQCITDPTPVSDLSYVKLWDAQRGVAAGLACTGGCGAGEQPSYLTVMLRTYDGGATWTYDEDYEAAMPDVNMQILNVPGPLTGMLAASFADPNSAFLVGQYEMIMRYDADWIEDPEQTAPPCDSSAAGDGGVVVRPDGGLPSGDGGTGPGADALSGCGCRTGAPGDAGAPLAAFVLGLIGLALRRRKGSR